MIPFEIRKIKDIYNVTIPLEDSFEDGVIDKVKKIEKLFEKLLIETKEKMKEIKEVGNNDAKMHWELGDIIYKFKKTVEGEGFYFQDEVSTFARYNGQSRNKWNLCIKLRVIYPKKSMIGRDLKLWGRLSEESDEKVRSRIEGEIHNKEIKTKEDIERALSLIKTSKLPEPSPQHKKILNVLKNEDLTLRDIAKKTDISHISVRGRISELRGRYGYSNKIIKNGEKYHLIKN